MQAPLWPNIKWRDTFKSLPELLRDKMEQHNQMIEDAKERNSEIRKILDKRRASVRLASSIPSQNASRSGARAVQEVVEDAETERTASRLRHCLASLKTWLQHDSWQLKRQHLNASSQKQVYRYGFRVYGLGFRV